MDNLRLILMMSLGFVAILLWQAWQEDYGQIEKVDQATQSIPADQFISQEKADLPSAPVEITNVHSVDQSASNVGGEEILIETDVLKLTINTRGGDVRSAELLNYAVEQQNPDVRVVLFDDKNNAFYSSQGGLLSKQEAANHHTIYTSESNSYRLNESQESLEVTLNWQGAEVEVEKTFVFYRNSYQIDIKYKVINKSNEIWQGRYYEQLHRKHTQESRKMLPTFTGAAYSLPEKRYEKLAYDDMQDEPLSEDAETGWVAMLQHYFVTALIPEQGQNHHYYSKVLEGDHYIIGVYGPSISLASGEEKENSIKLYVGPKLQNDLEKIAPNLELTTDYGTLWFISKPLFWLLDKIHDFVGNWGWAIIFVTILIKLFFYPLSAAGYKSMARMRKFQPKMQSIKERYGDDRARMNQAMMDLYKKEKINPLGGCFPILIQIPVFLALYWVLLESVEMRQADFMLWITDLSSSDPYFVLPAIMGISMVVQQKLNPAPMDPMQQKIMQFLPVIFTFFFIFFPAGLVLYWVVNNILSIAQQWMITRQIESEKK